MDGVNVLALAGQGWCVIGTYHKVNNSYGQWWVYGGVGEGGGEDNTELARPDFFFRLNDSFHSV